MKYCGLHTSKHKLANVHNGSLHHCRENTDDPTPGQQLGQRPVKFGKSWGAINVGNMQKERAGVE